ncbi:unnamed protein product [Clavelina lepadiformis]|uniref:Uncharacterized protein n=1 Tax=Clavelina lepadiformis TaxID=159417 RepID=A0ABP0G3X4_CLALP
MDGAGYAQLPLSAAPCLPQTLDKLGVVTHIRILLLHLRDLDKNSSAVWSDWKARQFSSRNHANCVKMASTEQIGKLAKWLKT